MRLMKHHPKLKALLCLCSSFMLGMILLTIIYWLLIHPYIQESRLQTLIMIVWIMGGGRLCFWLLTRYTPWGKILEQPDDLTKK